MKIRLRKDNKFDNNKKIKAIKNTKTVAIYFSPETLRVIKAESEKSPYTETGGILLGRKYEMATQIIFVVFHTSGPGPRAFKTPIALVPDIDYYNEMLINGRNSGGLDYLGEWHKHPAGFENTSLADLEQVNKIFTEEERDFMICPIVFEKLPAAKGRRTSPHLPVDKDMFTCGRFAIKVFYFSRGSKKMDAIIPQNIHKNSAFYKKLIKNY